MYGMLLLLISTYQRELMVISLCFYFLWKSKKNTTIQKSTAILILAARIYIYIRKA
jgi:hypothetical protein